MNELSIFSNREFGEVRTTEIDGKTYFVANDVAKALGYAKPNNAINTHCKGATLIRGIITDSLGRKQDALVIPEGDIYRLVIKSQLPTADRFERWIFDEVIPQIRKTGSYNNPLSELEALQIAVNRMVEQERRLTSVEDKVKQIEAKTSTVPNEYYTISGYANVRGKRIDVNKANQLGRYAARLSRKWGYEIGKAHSEVYGTVNTYHLDILKDAFRGV